MLQIDPPTRPPRRARRLLIAAGVLVVLLAVLFALVPRLLSTSAGRAYILSKVNGGIAGRVKVDSLSLAWGSGQTVTGFELLDPDGATVLTAKTIELPDASLWSFLTGSRAVGLVRVNDPRLTLVQDTRGLNLARAIAGPGAAQPRPPKPATPAATQPAAAPISIPANLALKIELVGGVITYAAPNLPAVEVSSLALTADLTNPANLTATIASRTRVGEQSGELNGRLAVTDAFDRAGQSVADKGSIDVTLDAKGIPVSLLDTLASQNGRLAALAGATATGSVTAKGAFHEPEVALSFKADRASLQGGFTAGRSRLAVHSPIVLALRVTPESWAALGKGQDPAHTARLTEPFDLTFRVDRFSVPRSGSHFALGDAAVTVIGEIGPAVMDAPGVGRLALRNTKLHIEGEALAKAVQGGLHFDAEQGGQAGAADLSFNIKNLLGNSNEINLKGLVASLNGQIKALPLAVIDQLTASDGLLVEAIGPTLDATLSSELSPAAQGQSISGPFRLIATGRGLQADLSGEVTPRLLRVQDGGRVTLTLTPALVALLTHAKPGDTAAPRLTAPSVVQVEVRNFSMPIAGGAIDAHGATFNIQTSVDRIALAGMGIPGGAEVSKVSIGLKADRLDKATTIELSSLVNHDAKPGTFTARAVVRDIVDRRGAIYRSHASVDYDVEGKGLSTALVDGLLGRDGVLVLLMGPLTDARANGSILPSNAARGRDYSAKFTVRSSTLSFDADAAITPSQITLQRGGVLTLRLDPTTADSLLRRFSGTGPVTVAATTAPAASASAVSALGLAVPANLRVNISSLDIPRGEGADRAQTRVGMSGSIDQLALSGTDTPVSLRDVSFTLADGVLANPVQLTVNGKLVTPQSEGSVKTVATVTNAMADQRRLDLSVQATSLPMAPLDALTGQRGRVVALMGPTLGEVNLTLQGTAAAMTYSARVNAQRLKADLAGSYEQGRRVTVKDGSSVDLTLTPEGFAAWTAPEQGAPPLALDNPTHVLLTVKQTDVNYTPADPKAGRHEATLDPANAKINASVSVASATFVRPDRQTIRLRDLTGSVESADLSKLLDIQFQTRIDDSSATQAAGVTTSSTQVRGLGMTKGKPDLSRCGFTTHTVTQAFPVDLLDALLKQEGKLQSLFGKSVTFTLDGARETGADGTLDLTLESANAKAALRGTIDPKMVFRLREDATAALKVTPELAHTYLAALNPMLNDVKSSDQPMKLTVFKDGFLVPLDNAKLSTITVKGRLEIGTLIMTRNEMAGGLTFALRALGSPIKDQPEFPAAFTPLEFRIADGVITSNDLWMDTGELLLGTQARISERPKAKGLYADVLIAIPSETMALVPGVAGNIPADALYELTANGPTSKIKPDYGAFLTGAVAPIVARSSKDKNAAIAAQGLELAGGLFGKDKKKTADAAWADKAWPNRPKVKRAETPAAAPAQPAAVAPGQPVAPSSAQPTAPAPGKTTQAQPTDTSQKSGGLGGLLDEVLRQKQESDQRKKDEKAQKKAATKSK
ncbi:MAG: hypothetical protein K8S99_10015 [Planctomycetes bacterium]|nr:hypothetical protein [Planctomycetota bacterium]